MKVPLTPGGLHMVTELLEALDWDEEMLVHLMEMFVKALAGTRDPLDAEKRMLKLKGEITNLYNDEIAQMAVNAFMVSVTHWTDKEIEA